MTPPVGARSSCGAPSPSLRTRLLQSLIVSLTLGVLAVGIGVFASAQDEIDELFDAQIAQAARTILELPLAAGDAHHDLPEAVLHPYEHKLAYLLRETGGKVLHRSPFADLGRVPLGCAGFQDWQFDDQRWRVACFASPARGLHVVVGQRLDIREELETNIVVSQFLPFLLALPLVVGLAWLAVGRGLQPLDTLSADIGRRSPRDLQPVESTSVPAEVVPIVAALNRLLAQVAQRLDQERSFTSDAAHELRTPLAALRTQAEVARDTLPAGEGRRALDKVVQGVERAGHLVEQLLALSRVDDRAALEKQPVALHPLARETIADVIEQAGHREVDVSLAGDVHASAPGEPGSLRILLRNLVDNAVRYTPDGGTVVVRVADGLLEVQDDGPGIAPGERERVLERFYRGPDAMGTGAGLGLSIVARIAELHEANVALLDGEGGKGLRVRVVFRAGGDTPPGR